LFHYVKITNGYYYNFHKATNGDSYFQRRWQLGERGHQKDHVKITTDFDTKWLTDKALIPQVENDIEPSKYLDSEGYFEHLAR
jgi:hypothetical protein